MNLQVSTIDDAIRGCLEQILNSGSPIQSTKAQGEILEIVGVNLELTNPRARLCQAESRATLFSCLGEFLWYLSKDNALDFIQYYAKNYAEFVDVIDGKVPAAYGPRLFAWDGINQVESVVRRLRNRLATKQATIQIFDRSDLNTGRQDVPCTCTLQFLCRSDQLHLIANMRSNDAVLGLPHDIFAFTMLQELVARSISVEVGTYRHWVASLHIYDKDKQTARDLISEGWQQTVGAAMPSMPIGDPWSAVSSLLLAESAFRVDKRAEPWPSVGSEYWDGLIWLLEMLRHITQKDLVRADAARLRLHDQYFDSFIDSRLQKLREKA